MFLNVYPKESNLGVSLDENACFFYGGKEESAFNLEGETKLTIEFNVHESLLKMKEGLCSTEKNVETLKANNLLNANGNVITYASQGAFIFGCRLVNSRIENQNQASADIKRTYLPWESEGEAIYKGFKCRIFIPIAKDPGSLLNWNYKHLYAHSASGTGTFEELKQMKLRRVLYKTKE